jgi:hypothetical protein
MPLTHRLTELRDMSGVFKSGDRVRVRVEDHPRGYQAGDEGTVLRVATLGATDIHFYLVAVARDGRRQGFSSTLRTSNPTCEYVGRASLRARTHPGQSWNDICPISLHGRRRAWAQP